jgi:hypothetical protein
MDKDATMMIPPFLLNSMSMKGKKQPLDYIVKQLTGNIGSITYPSLDFPYLLNPY